MMLRDLLSRWVSKYREYISQHNIKYSFHQCKKKLHLFYTQNEQHDVHYVDGTAT